jgi:uncharacterized protein
MPNSLMIRANGRVGKCTVALNDERNDIGYLTKDGKLKINENFQLWIKGLETQDKKMLACPLGMLNPLLTANEK